MESFRPGSNHPSLHQVTSDVLTPQLSEFSDINWLRNTELSSISAPPPARHDDTRNLPMPFGGCGSNVDIPPTGMVTLADVMKVAWSGGLFNVPPQAPPDTSDASSTSDASTVEHPPAGDETLNNINREHGSSSSLEEFDDDFNGSEPHDIYIKAARQFTRLQAMHSDERELDVILSRRQAKRTEATNQQMERQDVQSARSILISTTLKDAANIRDEPNHVLFETFRIPVWVERCTLCLRNQRRTKRICIRLSLGLCH